MIFATGVILWAFGFLVATVCRDVFSHRRSKAWYALHNTGTAIALTGLLMTAGAVLKFLSNYLP